MFPLNTCFCPDRLGTFGKPSRIGDCTEDSHSSIAVAETIDDVNFIMLQTCVYSRV